MKHNSKIALGGIISALSLALMLMTSVLPFLTYTLPILSGALLMLIVIEIGKKWALYVYISVSIISMFILADKESAIMYLMFFGYFPILKSVLEKKLKGFFEYLIKFLVFNSSILLSYVIIVYIFRLPVETMTKTYLVLILISANVLFYMYDLMLTKLVMAYISNWRKSFIKLFK